MAAMKDRVVIIGNSGSGKSYLARNLNRALSADTIQLDQIFWEPGGFNEKRPREVVEREIEGKRMGNAWIVEGVFGELAARFLDRAELLFWLDMPWETCRSGLLARGSESAKQLDPARAEANFEQLLAWAADYWKRADPRSHSGHARLFSDFAGDKIRFDQRLEVDRFLGRLLTEGSVGGNRRRTAFMGS
jgi:adenylate kinase family enzyme